MAKGKKKSRGIGNKIAKSGHLRKGANRASKVERPLPFLIKMRDKMKKNLPKLDRLVVERGGKSALA
jgi:hypothetical protein